MAVEEEASDADLRAANERLLSTGGLRRRPQPSPVELMREALDEPEDDRPEQAFVAAPALPIEEPTPTFVVKPSEGRAGRRGMDDLREQALRNVIANASDGGLGARAAAKAIPRRSGGLAPSRIILISVALVAGGLAAFLATQVNQPAPEASVEVIAEPVAAPTVQVLVAKEPIVVGARVTASAVEWADWPEAAVREEYVTSAMSPEAITELEGSVARSEILPGEPVLQQKLAAPGGGYLASVLETGKRGVSVPVNAASASGGFIQPNDRVDVVATRNLVDRRATETIVRNVRVLAVNGRLGDEVPAEGEESEGESAPSDGEAKVLTTLELDTAQAELIINAMAEGELTLVLRPFTDAPESVSEEEAANLAIRASSPFWLPQRLISEGTPR